LKDGCPIPVGWMIVCNEPSRAASYEALGDDDLFLVENLEPKKKVFADKKVGDGVKIEKD